MGLLMNFVANLQSTPLGAREMELLETKIERNEWMQHQTTAGHI
jgi:hypothetical protein